jgi:large subunit ribosomal protein L43
MRIHRPHPRLCGGHDLTSIRPYSAFIANRLSAFARENPSIEITVSPRPGRHPVVTGTYINGRQKPVCVRNMDPGEIMQKVLLLRNANGEKLKRVTKPVKSLNESVRGIWSPHHMAEPYRI